MARTLLFFAAFLMLASELDAQGRGGGGAAGGMRSGAGMGGSSMRGMGGSSMRGSSLHVPSSAMRGSSSMMRGPSISMRSPSSSAFRHPHDIGRSHSSLYHGSHSSLYHGSHSSLYHGSHSSIYHRPHSSYDRGSIGSIYARPYYPSTNYGLHGRSYPNYGSGYLYGGYYPYGYSAYSSLLDSRLYVAPSVVVVPSTRAYNSPSPTISSAAIVPRSHPAYDAASGPDRLARSLAGRSGGEVWLEYLTPDRVNVLIKSDNPATLAAELVQRYDGVFNNRELAWIANLNGFAETRSLLHQYASPSSPDDEPKPVPRPTIDPPEKEKVEDLPLPAPKTDATDSI